MAHEEKKITSHSPWEVSDLKTSYQFTCISHCICFIDK